MGALGPHISLYWTLLNQFCLVRSTMNSYLDYTIYTVVLTLTVRRLVFSYGAGILPSACTSTNSYIPEGRPVGGNTFTPATHETHGTTYAQHPSQQYNMSMDMGKTGHTNFCKQTRPPHSDYGHQHDLTQADDHMRLQSPAFSVGNMEPTLEHTVNLGLARSLQPLSVISLWRTWPTRLWFV